MSVTAMAVAWTRLTGSPGTKVVLMALADHANDEGVCWPGQETIARKAEMSTRSVRANLEKLVAAGFVRVEERRRQDGSRASNLYVLDMRFGVQQPEESSGHQPEEIDSSNRKSASGHEPSTEPSRSSSKKKTTILTAEEESSLFQGWLERHVAFAAGQGVKLSVPKLGTSYRSGLARTFAALLAEGYSLEELELASVGVLSDDYMKQHGHTKPDNVLRKEKIGRRVEDGRAFRAREAQGGGKFGFLDG